MILESRRYAVLAGYRRRSLLPAPCDAYLIVVRVAENGEVIPALADGWVSGNEPAPY